MATQIKIKEDGEWKATLNIDKDGNVLRMWGKELIDKIIIEKGVTKEDIRKQIDDLQELIDTFDDSILDEDAPQPTPEMLQDEIDELRKLL